ncbi:MAG: cytochrome C, partial [Gloeomargaritales cyanobacterium]
MSKFLAGGFPFAGIFPNVTIFSANITPDSATGIGAWTDGQIDTAFQAGKDDKGKQICPPMPWARFAGLSQSDAQAIIS